MLILVRYKCPIVAHATSAGGEGRRRKGGGCEVGGGVGEDDQTGLGEGEGTRGGGKDGGGGGYAG